MSQADSGQASTQELKGDQMTIAVDKDESRTEDPSITLIVPVYNEEDSIDIFLQEVNDKLSIYREKLELLFVNDGSSDRTLEVLFRHAQQDPRIKIVNFTKNFGKEAGMTAGLDHSTGQVVIPVDVDLQDPLEVIIDFVAKWKDGYDVVYGVRNNRMSDSVAKRATARWFYVLFNKLTNSKIPENVGDFRLMDRVVVTAVKELRERNRFMKGLFAWVGYKSIGVPYERPNRAAGYTKWNFWKLWNFALDGLISFSTVPLRVWTYLGVFISMVSMFYSIYIISRTLLYGIDVPGYASIMTAILFFGGVQLISLGVIGEYLGRLFIEVKNRPIYLVDKVYQFNGPNQQILDQSVNHQPVNHQAGDSQPRQ